MTRHSKPFGTSMLIEPSFGSGEIRLKALTIDGGGAGAFFTLGIFRELDASRVCVCSHSAKLRLCDSRI